MLTLVTAFVAAGASALSSPPLSDAIQRVDPIEYRVVLKGRARLEVKNADMPAMKYRIYEFGPVYLPFIAEGAFHRIDQSRMNEFLPPPPSTSGTVPKFQIVPLNGLGDYTARIDLLPKHFDNSYNELCPFPDPVDFAVLEYVTAFAARVDEAALARAQWPLEWPTDAQAALKPQMFIESDNERLVKLMNDWTLGRPKSVPPYHLGKELARRVVAAFQPSGQSVISRAPGTIESLVVQGAYSAAERGTGSPNDGICLFVALCRAAGLPARPVIGVEVNSRNKTLISWAEFYVPTAGWVSVNFDRLRDGPGMMRDMNRAWPGLGTDKNLNERVPLSYHFALPAVPLPDGDQPPPTLWTWHQAPVPMELRQTLEIDIVKAPKRSSGNR